MITPTPELQKVGLNLGDDLEDFVSTVEGLAQAGLNGLDRNERERLLAQLSDFLGKELPPNALLDLMWSLPCTTVCYDDASARAFFEALLKALTNDEPAARL